MARIINSDLSSLEENEYENGWRLKQAVTPFNEKMGVYGTEGYQIIVQHLAKKEEDGTISGIWGAMSDFSHSFNPWEDFNKGLYLAGVECRDDAEAPNGWTKRIIPGYEYIYIECENNAAFSAAIKYLEDNGIPLVGAVHDFICPQTGKILYRL